MAATHLRVVTNNDAAKEPDVFVRINAAVDRMMADARRMRIAAASLNRSHRELMASASRLEATLPMFEEAEQKLNVERDRALDIAMDAALIERRILQSSAGNIAPLTTGLPARLLEKPAAQSAATEQPVTPGSIRVACAA